MFTSKMLKGVRIEPGNDHGVWVVLDNGTRHFCPIGTHLREDGAIMLPYTSPPDSETFVEAKTQEVACACPQCRMGEPHEEAPVPMEGGAAKVSQRIAQLEAACDAVCGSLHPSTGSCIGCEDWKHEIKGLRFAMEALTGVQP
jgi:hypothetical protein